MSDFQRAGQKRRMAVRELTKGMFRDRAPQTIVDGGFWTVRNATVGPEGIRRRPAFYTIGDEDTFRDNAVVAGTYIKTDGTSVELLVTESSVYNIAKDTGLTLIPLEYDTGHVDSADGDTVTGTAGNLPTWTSATDWDNVQAGDYFVLDSEGTAVKIDSVTDATTLVLESTYPDTSFSDEAYTIYRGFRVEDTGFLVDVVTPANRAIFLSPYIAPLEIDSAGTALEVLQDGDDNDTKVNAKYFSAACGAYFQERLWLGYITEWVSGAYVTYRQRLRYSTATDIGDFDAASNAHYIDLDYTRGKLNAIKPMGNLLAVYLEDAIYLGQGTPDTNNPLVFDQVETGGIGLVGPRALCSYRGGHFFVGQDNIYFLSTRGLEAIGTPVLRETVRACGHKWRIQVTADPKRNRICFGFPESSESIAKVWNFNYISGAWSYEDYASWMISSTLFDDSLTWDDLTGTWDTLGTTYSAPTWDDLQAKADSEVSLLREFGGVIQMASGTSTTDDDAGAITLELESKDHDMNLADLEKCWTRLALKLNFTDGLAFDEAVDFTCSVSHNRGRTWKDVGTLRIRADMDEGYCDFRLTSSTFRFKLTSNAEVVPYYITEYSYSVTPFGEETHLGSQEGD